MQKPIFQNAQTVRKKITDVFGGLCRTAEIKENEFCEMKNCSSAHFPNLAPCKGRKTICSVSGIECIIAPRLIPKQSITAFTGVADNKFYYNGEVKLTLSAQQRRRTLVDFNGNILIFPDCKFYSYTDESSGDIAESICGTVKFRGADENNANRITFSDGFDDKFAVGDSLTIVCSEAANSTHQTASKYDRTAEGEIISCMVSRVVSDTVLELRCVDKTGANVSFVSGEYTEVTVSRAMPALVVACVANNRVFGADEFGETIYASKPGDFKNWYAFEGLASDSWYGNVGTEGPFTAMSCLGSTVVAFKHNYIHQVYGETPSNFAIPKQIAIGCIDGRSVAEIRGQLYFLSYDGVYVFSGGNPVKVSEALDTHWDSGAAGTDGHRYYLSAKCGEVCELLAYDTERGLWHREDDFCAVGFFRYNDSVLAASSDGLYELGAGSYDSWYAVSKKIESGTADRLAAVCIYLRMEMDAGSTVSVFVSADGNGFERCADFTSKSRAVWRVPVRFRSAESYQIKLEGSGGMRLLALEQDKYTGARDEANRW